jgi:GTP-dependent phosphoenolpyruvate carboxykinase
MDNEIRKRLNGWMRGRKMYVIKLRMGNVG